jgi:hypothetical protein
MRDFERCRADPLRSPIGLHRCLTLQTDNLQTDKKTLIVTWTTLVRSLDVPLISLTSNPISSTIARAGVPLVLTPPCPACCRLARQATGPVVENITRLTASRTRIPQCEWTVVPAIAEVENNLELPAYH